MRTHNHIGAIKQLASLEAWKCANALARSAYRLTLRKPLSGHFGLSDQIRRAAVSVPANMVEGYALGTTLQFILWLRGGASLPTRNRQGPGSSGRGWRRGRAHVGRARHPTPRWAPAEAGRTNPTHTIPLSPFPFPRQEKESRIAFVT